MAHVASVCFSFSDFSDFTVFSVAALQQEETANVPKQTGGRFIFGDSGDSLALALPSQSAFFFSSRS